MRLAEAYLFFLQHVLCLEHGFLTGMSGGMSYLNFLSALHIDIS